MIYDLHNDLLTTDLDKSEITRQYAADAVKGVIFAVWTSKMKPDKKRLCVFRIPESDFCARSAIEDLGSVKCGTDEYREIFDNMRPAYVSLTWNGENALGGGCGHENPLTEKGKAAVRALADADIPLDLSHLSDAAFYSALDEADKCGVRVLVTHTASRRLSAHPRNITDDMAKETAMRGGIIGVAAVPNFLDDKLRYGENCGISRFVDHIEHLCSVAGADRVAIGSDLCGTEYMPVGLDSYGGFREVAEELLRRGFTKSDTEKIFYGNAERFMR